MKIEFCVSILDLTDFLKGEEVVVLSVITTSSECITRVKIITDFEEVSFGRNTGDDRIIVSKKV